MDPSPHPGEALRFLACLHQCSPEEAAQRPTTWQTFDDLKPGGNARAGLARMIHGAFQDVAKELATLNRQGAGVFVTVCAGDGTGRRKPNMLAARGWWCDVDTKGAQVPLEDFAALPLAPTMTVQTPGGWHLYWLAEAPIPFSEDFTREALEAQERSIAQALAVFGGDLKATDTARVLRVPGFLHQKAEPRPVHLVQAEGPRYTPEEIRKGFPLPRQGERGKQQANSARSAELVRPAQSSREGIFTRAARYLAKLPPAICDNGGHNTTFPAALKLITGYNLSEEEALSLLWEHYNPRCEPPWSLNELRHKVADAWISAQRSPQLGHLLTESHNRTQPPAEGTKGRISNATLPDSPSTEFLPDSGKTTCEVPAEKGGTVDVPGFRWKPSGLFKVSTKAGPNADESAPEETWIAPPFSLPGLVRNEASSGWCLLIAWKDLDGAPHEEAIPFDLISGEGAELGRKLALGGLLIHPDLNRRKALLRFLAQAAPRIPRRALAVDTLGWHEGAFVLPGGECIGTSTEPLRFNGDPTAAGLQGVRGTIQGWQEGVARFAVGNPRLAFSIACAFAGPLLDLVRPDGGGGFNHQGSSSKGKSTCLEAAASVWGRPHPLPTWRATANGLEGIAAARNDGFLPLDELSQVSPQEAGQVAYMLANGAAKARATKDGGARPLKQWRLIFLSSAEQTLEDKLSEDGRRIRAGQEVRVPDIPCPEEGLFETPHELPSLGALAEHLKAEARKHYGHAARLFIGNLSGEWHRREALVEKLRERESAWLADAVPPAADGQVRRVAGRFALVALAGHLAQHMRILPWPSGEAERAALICFRAWLDRRGHVGASERERGLQAVVDFVCLHGLSRFADWNAQDAKPFNMAGVRRAAESYGPEGQATGWDFFITPTGWKEACKGFDPRAVARHALQEGLLEGGPKGAPYRNRKTPHGQFQAYVIRSQAIGLFRVPEAS